MCGSLRNHWKMGALLLVLVIGSGIAAGVAWAARSGPQVAKAPGFDLVRTYHVTLGPDEQTVIDWGKVGKVSLSTELWNSWDPMEGPPPGTPGWAAGGKGLITVNNGSTPVIVAIGPVATAPDWPYQPAVVEPGGSEAFGLVGEFVNQDLPHNALIIPLAVMSEEGASATGSFALSASIDQAGTAHFTASLQLRG